MKNLLRYNVYMKKKILLLAQQPNAADTGALGECDMSQEPFPS